MVPLPIHVYHPHAGELGARVRALAPDRRVIELSTREQLAAALPEIVVLFAPEPPREGWGSARALRLVQVLGAGVDHVLPSPDLPSTVEVAGARGEFSGEVAEHVVAMMLAHAHRIPVLLDDQRVRRFRPTPHPTLAGQRLAIVGLGAVGTRIAGLAGALGMVVRGISRCGRPCPGVEVVAADRLGDAVSDARFVAIALPLTPSTRHLIDAAILARLAPDAFLINVARGGVLDETALVDALRANRIAGAALDVFEHEPLSSDSELWSVPNAIVTPHVAGYGERYIERCAAILLDNVRRLEVDAPRRGTVDREAGY